MYPHNHLLGIDGLTAAQIETILARADEYADLNARREVPEQALAGRTVINLFFEPSTRTQASFELAAKRLGATVMNMAMKNSSITKGETLLDTAVSLNAMLPDMLVIRHSHSGAAALLSAKVNCAVVNAGDGWHEHPTQALLDALTIRRAFREQRGEDRLSGLRIAICGDVQHSRVARSNIFLHRAMGNEVRVAGPSTLIPSGLEALGVRVCGSLREAINDVDVVMMLRLQNERMNGAFIPSAREYFHLYGLDMDELKEAKPDALVMHPGPMNRGVEIDSEMADHEERSMIAAQVQMGVAARMAVLEILARNLPYQAPKSTRLPGSGPRRRYFASAVAEKSRPARTHLHNARLIDPEALSETPGGVLIEEGRILDVGPHLLDPDTVAEAWRIDCTGHAVAPGVIDLRVHAGEPGERHNESFGTVGEAAVAGGVTTIVTRPDTNPAVDDPALLDFIAKRIGEEQQQHAMPRVYSMAALTKGVAGELMAEFAFLTQHASCVGLSNGQRSVANAQVLRRCLAYAADLGALVSHHSQDPTLTGTGCATSGAFATRMGLPGPGPLAESMALERDLALALAAGVEYHAEQISVAASLEVLRRARERSGRISAAVSLPHLLFDEADIQDYRTFYKMFPPLRAGADRAAMVEALRGGLIDCITSSHRARNEESKRQPYEAAATGAVGVETLLSGAMELVAQGALSLPQLFEKLSLNPARRLSVMRPQIFSDLGRLSRGARADLIVFDDGLSWQLDRRWLRSKSKNSPFDKAMMRGLVRQTLVDGAVVHTAEPEPQGAP